MNDKLEQARILDEALPRLASTLVEAKDDELAGVYESSTTGNSGQFNDASVINSPSPKPPELVGGAGDEVPKTAFANSQTEETEVVDDLPPLRLPLEFHRTSQISSTSAAAMSETSEDPPTCPKADRNEMPPPRLLPDDAISNRQTFLQLQRDQLIHMRMRSIRETLAAAKPEDNNYRPRLQQRKRVQSEVD
ncbi:unnamed protein product [Schistocephalus solidus]|uniref:Uncharacterized protein n=1 Tax=Schistocephalus solidus TaxID=70667 RepID=A0A3P7CQ97_SCHSO|nr:unnamed protein product [Schistocephalus solidus]